MQFLQFKYNEYKLSLNTIVSKCNSNTGYLLNL